MLDIRFYFAVFLRRLPYFSVFVALGLAAGLVMALTLPPVYKAQARLIVESEQIPDELAASTVRTDASEQLQIIQQRILTRNTLLDMANRLGVYRSDGTRGQPLSPDEIVADIRERIVIDTRGGNVIRGQSQATIVTVSFPAPTAQLAANVTNEVVTLMLQENVDMRTSVAGQTLDFFSQQVERLESEINQISGEILVFKEANQNALPDSLDFRRNQQAAGQERLLEQERAESVLRDRRDRLELLYERTGSVSGLTPQAQQTSEERRLAELQDQYATSVAVLSLDNPRVAVLRSQIAALEGRVAEQKAEQIGAETLPDGTVPNEYDMLLTDLNGQIVFIEEQKARITTNLEILAASLAATPGNAVILEALERSYINTRTQYDQAVRNQASAETGDIIESLSKGQRISVIEQAIAPSSPVSPNRPQIAALGLLGGIAMGFGFIFLIELLNSAIRRPADLLNGLEITPMMTLPYLRTREQVWKRRLLTLVAVLVVLVGLPAVLWYVDQNVVPLQPIIQRIIDRLGLT